VICYVCGTIKPDRRGIPAFPDGMKNLSSHSRLKALMATLRAGLLCAGTLASVWFISNGRAAESEKKSPPNIVYILCDDSSESPNSQR